MPPGNENSASLEGQSALRVKVAELLGFTPHRPGGPNSSVIWWFKGGVPIHLPNYPNDLNACAEGFEKTLTGDDKLNYVNQLYFVTFTPGQDRDYGVVFATAEQRCRAFIAVMEGKEK